MAKLVIKEINNIGNEESIRLDIEIEEIGNLNEENFYLNNVKNCFNKFILKELYPNKDFVLDKHISYELTICDLEIKGLMYFSFSSYFSNINIITPKQTYFHSFRKDSVLVKPTNPMKKRHVDKLIEFCQINKIF